MQRIDYFVGIVGAILGSSATAYIVKRRRGRFLATRGIHTVVAQDSVGGPPGTAASRMTIMVGFGVGMVIMFASLVFCGLGLWSKLPAWTLVPLPRPLRWVALGLIWCYYGWGVAVVVYNVNYTPCYRGVAGEYYIATGGPTPSSDTQCMWQRPCSRIVVRCDWALDSFDRDDFLDRPELPG